MKKALCIMSGGMDSTLATYMTKKLGYELIGLHFNYGQKTEQKELDCFRKIVQELKILNALELDVHFIKDIGGSSLVDDSLIIPTAGIGKEIPNTYVPFRNGIFLSIATAVAEKYEATKIVIGAVEEDSSGYPDCRDEFLKKFEEASNLGTKESTDIQIFSPLVALKKEEIVQKAIEIGVRLDLTWSCYKNSDFACGVCDSCRLRLKGFFNAKSKDPIDYL